MKSVVTSRVRFVLLGVLLVFACPGVTQAASTASKKASQAAQSKRTIKTSTAKPAPAKKGSKGSASKPAAKASGGKTCYKTVVLKGRKQRVKTPCSAPAEPVITNSPINEKALQQSGEPLEGSPVKARSAPIRAYAVDGATFYQNGRKFRIEGVTEEGALSNGHEAHKLQQILDSGAVTTEPIGNDDNGAMRAVVKVDGRNVVELMRMRP